MNNNKLKRKAQRADQLVFEAGLAESREQAKRFIMAGKVYIKDADSEKQPLRIDKPGQQIYPPVDLVIEGVERFVSRGAYKLLTLIEHFSIDVKNKVALDAGASTGGFTDCLLQHGASKVYAVDVGHNQLHERLKHDSRVVSIEGVNLRSCEQSLLPEQVDILVADLSFISLTLVLPACMKFLKHGALVAALIKPQFELGPACTEKGIVRDPLLQQEAVNKVCNFASSELALNLLGVVPSALKGSKGNQEFMALWSYY